MSGAAHQFEILPNGPLLAARPRVLSVSGKERANGLYAFDIRIAVDPTVDLTADDGLLERPIQVAMLGGELPRTLHGVVLDVAAEGGTAQGSRIYRLRVGPRLALLKRRRYSRIFMGKMVPDIVTAILDEHRITYRLRLTRLYRVRTYTVQYHESDYAFLRRLFADVGIFFSFDHPTARGSDAMTNMGSSEVLVLGDSPDAYAPVEGNASLVAIADAGALDADDTHVFTFTGRRRPRPTVALERAYDFMMPRNDLRSSANVDTGGPPHLVYNFGGEGDESPPDIILATTRLEQERARAFLGEGTSACRRLMPGRTFRLDGHDVASLSRSYVVTEVEHTAYAAEAAPAGQPLYRNRFECTVAEAPIRPKRVRKPQLHAVETAVVVGPEGKEIHTDEDGRIQVQFHWDLAGKLDGTTSTWLRVATAWAGVGYGIQFIPRIGMEVVVTFIGGDIDRPLVTGCVYNRTHPHPFPQPAELTKTGIRTATTPGGEGFNELSFDDAKGAEMLFMNAQRDHVRVVNHDEGDYVGNDQKTQIGHDRIVDVKERDLLTVGKERIVKVAGSQTERSMSAGSMTWTTGGATFSLDGNNASIDADGDITLNAKGNVFINGQTVSINGGDVLVTADGGLVKLTGGDVVSIGGTIKEN